MKSADVATVRTTVNASVLAALLALIARLTHWQVQAEDLLPYMPIIIPVVAAFYRLSLMLSKRYPWLGTILYGVNAAPVYPSLTTSNKNGTADPMA